ncbi:hypothetical protein BGZ70_001655, partial [Mortierella alpina]
TQAVLLAWLCHRYHDLATYASESLKQRIHFLAKPDGSNLQDLFIWDPPARSTSTSTSSSAWSSAQIQEFIQCHWSADQLPLNPPHPHSAWDAVPVYCRELDPETLHAIVPLGQQDQATVAVVLAVVKGHHAPKEGDMAPCWRYHNMVVMQESELHSSHGWYPFSEWMALQRETVPNNDPVAAPRKQEQAHGSDTAGDEDSDDDYWGQYNDSEDEDDDTSAAGAEGTVQAATEAKTTVDNKDDHEDDEDDEDEYWRKYAEQQEQQDRDERKKKMQESSAHHPLESTTTLLTTDHEDHLHEDHLPSLIHSSTTRMQESTTHNLLGASASSFPSTRPGQLDPTMLSSLMQMLVTQGMDQSTSPPSSTPLPSTTTTMTTTEPSLSASSVAHPNADQGSKSRIIESLRSIVQDCHRAGFSKDEVFEMLQSAYSTSHLSAE